MTMSFENYDKVYDGYKQGTTLRAGGPAMTLTLPTAAQ